MKRFYFVLVSLIIVMAWFAASFKTTAQSETNQSGDAPAVSPNIVISQFQVAGSNANDEFIELHNTSSNVVDLNGFRLVYRSAAFRPDPQLPADWYHVLPEDYLGSGYDRGHMTPSGDRTRSIPDNSATFLMTNILPQIAANNQGPWEEFESYCRTLAQAGNELYIVSGGAGVAGTIAGGKIVVPQVTWKVVLVLPNGDDDLQRINRATRTIGIIVPNQPPLDINAPWRNFRVSVNAVETLTGYNFFSNIPKNTQELIERKKDRQ